MLNRAGQRLSIDASRAVQLLGNHPGPVVAFLGRDVLPRWIEDVVRRLTRCSPLPSLELYRS